MYSTPIRYADRANMDRIHRIRVKTLLPSARNISSRRPTVTITSARIPTRMRC